MNKKGAISAALADFVGFAVFILILLIFSFIFGADKQHRDNEITGQVFSKVNGDQLLSNFLSSSVEYKGDNVSILDAMGLFYDETNYVDNHETNEAKDLENKILKNFFQFTKNSGICTNFVAQVGRTPILISSHLIVPCQSSIESSVLNIYTRSGKRFCVGFSKYGIIDPGSC